MEAHSGQRGTREVARRLGLFERCLSLWVILCMGGGLIVGSGAPSFIEALRDLEIGENSQINFPIAVLLWLMITPMMMRVYFGAIRDVGKKPKGLLITLFVNWLVKPFSMALIAYLFFRHVFSVWISPAEADQYVAGSIILAAAPWTLAPPVGVERLRALACSSTAAAAETTETNLKLLSLPGCAPMLPARGDDQS